MIFLEQLRPFVLVLRGRALRVNGVVGNVLVLDQVVILGALSFRVFAARLGCGLGLA